VLWIRIGCSLDPDPALLVNANLDADPDRHVDLDLDQELKKIYS
jgi:hypothetical protein